MGEIVGVEPVVSREEWERLRAMFDGRRHGRPPGAVHVLSGLMRCATCATPVPGAARSSQPPFADGSPRREYRCRPVADRDGCMVNHIDAQPAEFAVDEAMRARLGDPRRAAKVAAYLSKLSKRRADIEAELARLGESADELAGKTAAWGLARVDKAMAPLLARMDALRSDLAGLAAPNQAQGSADDAVAEWVAAWEGRDMSTMRTLIKRTFPNLTLLPPARHRDHGPHRLVWD